MRDLKQVNNYYNQFGYRVVLNEVRRIEVYYNEVLIHTAPKSRAYVRVAVTVMEETPWLTGESCEIEYLIDHNGNLDTDPVDTEDLIVQIDLLLGGIQTESPEGIDNIPENDNHSQHLEAGYCYQTMPSGVVHVYDPDGNPHIATDIDNADQCIRDGVWNCGQQCPVEVHISPIDDCGNQEVVISSAINDSKLLLAQGYDPDEHWLCKGVVLTLDGDVEVGHISEPCYRPAYLTEQEYRYSEALMEF